MKRSLIQFIVKSFKNLSFKHKYKSCRDSNQVSCSHIEDSSLFMLERGNYPDPYLLYLPFDCSLFVYLIVYRRYYILLQRPGNFIFTFCSVWQSRNCTRGDGDGDIERNLLHGEASHLQKHVRRRIRGTH